MVILSIGTLSWVMRMRTSSRYMRSRKSADQSSQYAARSKSSTRSKQPSRISTERMRPTR
jgi:hypothetical protein